jgi:hypothetical protein
VCTPTISVKKKGKKDNEGDEIVNCHLMFDADLIRLVIDIEERDFECKLSYSLNARPNPDLWWLDKQPDLKEWLTTHGHEELIAPVCTCVMRMFTPLRAKIKELSTNKPLVPTEEVVRVFKWAYGVKRAERNNLTIEADNRSQKVTIDYQTTIDKQERAVVVHASIRMDDRHATAKSVFSYKADEKMHTVGLWTQAQRAIHAQASESAGIPGEPASYAFGKAMDIVWAGVTDAMAERHEKKSKKKNEVDDGGLFDEEGI